MKKIRQWIDVGETKVQIEITHNEYEKLHKGYEIIERLIEIKDKYKDIDKVCNIKEICDLFKSELLKK
jgi:hypothetical protein